MNIVKTKLEFIFTTDWMNRITFPETGDDKITIDLHCLSCKEAEKLVKDVIAVTKGPFKIELIHGYNSGTALKETIYNHKISGRISKRTSPGYNLGVTELIIAA